MAVPTDMTTLDLSGKFVMNKTLTDTNLTDQMLSMQGVGWLKRTAIAAARVTMHLKHYKDQDGIEHIDMDQILTGGIQGNREERIVDWQDRHKSDPVFGHVVSKSRRTKLDDIEVNFLKEDWSDDCTEHGVILTTASSDTPKSGMTWVAQQAWGFEILQGERRHIRHVDFKGPNEEHIECKIYYDYLGAL